jgi:hypothetical protein
MGTRLERIPHSKFLEELTRPGIELLWKYYLDRNVVIASHAPLERRRSLAAQAKPPPILRARRQGHGDLAINRWDINFGTEENLGERHRHLTQNVIALAGQIGMWSRPYDNVEISRGATVPASLAFTSYSYFGTRIDPRRYFDLQAFRPSIASYDLHLRGGAAH